MTYAEVWGPITFLAALLTGVGLGWLGAVTWWNAEARKQRVKTCDPLLLAERRGGEPYPTPVVGAEQISEQRDRYVEIKVVPEEDRDGH